MKKIVVVIFIFASTVYGALPYWVDSPYQKYSDDLYISKVGRGDSREAAENEAFIMLSELFGFSIENEALALEYYFETDSASKSSMIYLNDNTRTASKHYLVNVEKEMYYDGITDTHYVLAFLHKRNTSKIIKNTINENNILVNEYLRLAEREKDYLRKYSLIILAVVVAKKSEALDYQLPYLGEDAKSYITHKHSSLIRKMGDDLAYNLTFAIDISSDNLILKHSIEQTITDLNMQVVGVYDNASYRIKEKIQYIEHDNIERFATYKIDYSYRLSLVNSIGKTIATFNFNGVTRGESKKRALARVKNRLVENIEKNFETKFANYLNKMSDNTN